MFDSWIIATVFVVGLTYVIWWVVRYLDEPHMSRRDIERRIGK